MRGVTVKKLPYDRVQPRSSVSGYVGMRFADTAMAKNDRAHQVLFERFTFLARRDLSDNDTFVEFEVQPTLLRHENESVWSFSLWILVRGCASPEDAKAKWCSTLEVIQGILLGTS
jgi:hypothetical protein